MRSIHSKDEDSSSDIFFLNPNLLLFIGTTLTGNSSLLSLEIYKWEAYILWTKIVHAKIRTKEDFLRNILESYRF